MKLIIEVDVDTIRGLPVSAYAIAMRIMSNLNNSIRRFRNQHDVGMSDVVIIPESATLEDGSIVMFDGSIRTPVKERREEVARERKGDMFG